MIQVFNILYDSQKMLGTSTAVLFGEMKAGETPVQVSVTLEELKKALNVLNFQVEILEAELKK